MCSLTAAGLALSAVSTVTGFYTSMKNAEAQEDAAYANYEMAERNAELREDQAADAIERGKIEEQNRRRRTMLQKGEQQATIGASGILMESGTASQILQDTAEIGELDALTIRHNAQNEADYYNQLADNTRYGGRVGLSTGLNQASNTRRKGIGSFATSAGQVANKWHQRGGKTGGGGKTAWDVGGNNWAPIGQ